MAVGLRQTQLSWLALVVSFWYAFSAGPAAEQHVDFGGVIGPSFQAQGDSGFDGSAIAGIVFIDRDISNRRSLGAETSLSADIRGRQLQRAPGGTNDLNSRHHDTVFSGLFKLKVVSLDRAHVAAVGGAGLAWRHTIRAGTFRSDQPPFTTTPVEQILSNVVFAATLGFDGAVAVGPRTDLVFIGRIHFLVDDDRNPTGGVRRGVASRIGRFGGGARFLF